MKQITSLLIFNFILSTSFSQTVTVTGLLRDFNRNDRKLIKSKKITREYIYNYKLRKRGIIDSFLFKIIYYDTLGDVRTEIEDIDKKPVFKEENLLQNIKTHKYVYNADGRLKKLTIQSGINRQANFAYGYDSAGDATYEYIYNKDTTSVRIEKSEYNEHHQIIKLFSKINNDSIFNSAQYFYDDKDRLLKESIFDKKGIFLHAHIYDYSQMPQKKSIYIETKDNKKLCAEFYYNGLNQLIKKNGEMRENAIDIGKRLTDNEKYFRVEEYAYNADGTFFQWGIYYYGVKSQLTRHYYFTD